MAKKEKDMTDGPKQHENIVIKDLMKIFNKKKAKVIPINIGPGKKKD